MKIRANKKLKISFYVMVVWFALHSIYICIDGLHSDKGNADAEIVLGNEVYADSSVSLPLKGRLDKALELYVNKRVKKIFVSGGHGDNGVGEGSAMKTYLIKKNVPAIDIIADNNGKNTYFTAKDFIAISDSMHFTSAIVVTSFYHITRSKYIIRKLGFNHVKGVSSDVLFAS